MTIRLLTLGGLSSSVNGEELDWLASQWLRAAVLVHLTVERVATRDALLAMFWPDNDGDTAGHRLSQTVYALRRALGDEAIETRGRELRAGPHLECDALDFERAAQEGRFEDAIVLYRGPFLNGVHLAPTNAFQMWVDARRAAYARSFRKVCKAAIDQRVSAGDLAGAVSAAHAWVAPDPLDDEAQHRLIELLALSGERTVALKHYQVYVRVLEAEGLEPLDQTRELIADVEKQTNGVVFPMASGGAPQPLPAVEVDLSTTKGLEVAETAPRQTSPSRLVPGKARRRWRWAVTSLLAALLFWLSFQAIDSPVPPSAEAATDLPVPIAVLVFRDLTEGRLSSLATGVTSSLIDAFQTVDGLTVRSFYAVWPYRGGGQSEVSIALSLQVRYLIVGHVEESGDGRRILARAELVDGRSGDMVRQGSVVERTRGEDLELVNAVVQDVAAKLQGHLIRDLGRELRFEQWRAKAGSPKVFRLVQEATNLVFEREPLIASGNLRRAWESLRTADTLLGEAVREDPEWAEPRILRGWVARHIAAIAYGIGVDRDSVRAAIHRGLAHVQPAVSSADSARALEIRGVLNHLYARMVPSDSSHARRLFEEASRDLIASTRANGRLARAYSSLSSIRFMQGDFAAAASLGEKAYWADAYFEDAQEILNRLFTHRFEAAEDDAAVEWCNVIRQRFPDGWDHARCALHLMAWTETQPDPTAAWRLAERAIASAPEFDRARVEAQLHFLVAAVLAKAGATDAEVADSARRVVARTRIHAIESGLDLASPTNSVLPREEAGVHVLLGDYAEARRLLGSRYPAWVETSRRFKSLF